MILRPWLVVAYDRHTSTLAIKARCATLRGAQRAMARLDRRTRPVSTPPRFSYSLGVQTGKVLT